MSARRVHLGPFAIAAALASTVAAQDPLTVSDEQAIDDLTTLSRLATTTARPLERVPSTVTIISGDDVRRSGARFLPDALRMLPGVEVNRISSTEVSVNVRGYNGPPISSQGILALVDGRQAYNAWIGYPLWDNLPVDMEELDRLEVLLGPGSFVYGPNAMHGVVNIVTKSPLSYDRDRLSLGSAAGTYGSRTARLMSVRREKNFAIKTTLLWDDIEQFEPPGARSKDKGSAEVRLEALLDEDDPLHRIDITANRSSQDNDVLIPTLTVIPPATFATASEEAFVRAEYQNHGFRLQASWTGFEGHSVPDTIYVPYKLDLDTADLDLQYTSSPWIGHSVTVGTGIRSSTAGSHDEDITEGRHSATTTWLFLQDEVDLSDQWFLTTGVRLDNHSVVGSNVSPRVALIWEFDKEVVDDETVRTQTLRASYGQGFRYPALFDLWFDLPVNLGPITFPIVGNRDLEQEQLESVELAYTGTFGRNHLTATAFYNRIEDLISFVASMPATRMNGDDEKAYGLELSGDRVLSDWLTGFANYSLTHVDFASGRGAGEPRNKFNVGLRASLSREERPDLGVHATLWFNNFDSTESGGERVDGYSLLNAYVDYTFLLGGNGANDPRGRFYVQAFNLLDDVHVEHPDGDEYGALVMAGFGVDL